MKDFYYDETTKDIVVTTGKDLRFTSDLVEYTIQKIEKVLGFVYGEWYLNTTLGIPYLALENNERDDRTKNIFVKNPDLSFINGVFIKNLKDIEVIEKIIDFTSVLNTSTRSLTVSFEIKMINGELLQSSLNIGIF